ncbi:MAG TPA: hypothetical protein V6D14_02075 [Coleofasciculaceae cyanobacterium]
MQDDEQLRFSALKETSFNQVNPTSAKSIVQPDGTIADIATLPDGTLFLVPISFMMVWAIIVLMYSDIWKIARHGMLTRQHTHQVPCRNCQFFIDNPYLKCAVHPSTALTSQALNCSDYCSKNRRC